MYLVSLAGCVCLPSSPNPNVLFPPALGSVLIGRGSLNDLAEGGRIGRTACVAEIACTSTSSSAEISISEKKASSSNGSDVSGIVYVDVCE